MSDPTDVRGAPRGRLPMIAVGLAIAALGISVVAVIVVVTRAGPAAGAVAAVAAEDAGSAADTTTVRRTVLARDVVGLDREAIATAFGAGGAAIGITVTDAELRTALDLEPTDVITTISGRTIRRQFDIYDALLGASTMQATTLYVELLRDGQPVLARWLLDGDLRAARTGRPAKRTPYANPFSSPRAVAPVADPLLATITKLGDLHYTMPRATLEQVTSDPAMMMRSARVVPSTSRGQPDGIKLFAIRPGSLLASLGLANGDTLQLVNGISVFGPDNLLDVFTRVKGASELTVELMRRGQPQVLKITITP